MESHPAREIPYAASGGKEADSLSKTSSNNIVAPENERNGSLGISLKWLNRGVALPLLAGILFLLLWEKQVFHGIFGLKKYQLPLPSAIAEAMRDNISLLLSYTGYTLAEAVIGMLIGSACGFLIALAATAWPRWAEAA